MLEMYVTEVLLLRAVVLILGYRGSVPRVNKFSFNVLSFVQ